MPFFRQFSSQPSSHTESKQSVTVMSSTASGHPPLAVEEESTVGLPGKGEEEEEGEEKDKTLRSLEKQERGRDETNIDVDTLKR